MLIRTIHKTLIRFGEEQSDLILSNVRDQLVVDDRLV